jgi:hypothetical protein
VRRERAESLGVSGLVIAALFLFAAIANAAEIVPIAPASPTPSAQAADASISPEQADPDPHLARSACDRPVVPIDLTDPAVAVPLADLFLDALEAPKSPAMRGAVLAWVRSEGWDHGVLYNNNPLSLRVRGAGVCRRWNSAGVAVLDSPERGMRYAALRLARPENAIYGYGAIVAAARAGAARDFLLAVARSAWSGDYHYGCSPKRDGANVLDELWALTDPERAVAVGC